MTSYERVKVVRQGEQRQTHPVGHEPMARQPSPVQRLLPLLDPLLGCPSTIVEPYHSFGASRHVRDDEAHPREQPSPIPRHLGHHPPSAVTTPGTIPKVVVLGSLDSPAASPQEITRRCAVCVIARPTHLAFTRPNPSTLPSWVSTSVSNRLTVLVLTAALSGPPRRPTITRLVGSSANRSASLVSW